MDDDSMKNDDMGGDDEMDEEEDAEMDLEDDDLDEDMDDLKMGEEEEEESM